VERVRSRGRGNRQIAWESVEGVGAGNNGQGARCKCKGQGSREGGRGSGRGKESRSRDSGKGQVAGSLAGAAAEGRGSTLCALWSLATE